MAVCLSSSSSYLVSLEPVEEGERVNRHGANNEENVEDGECDQELVEEMGPAHPYGSEERGQQWKLPFRFLLLLATPSLPSSLLLLVVRCFQVFSSSLIRRR